MYRVVQNTGDMQAVPRLLFSKLTAPGADEARFRVALYVLGQGGGEVAEIAAALRLQRKDVEKALVYWEGAGLLENEEASAPAAPPVSPRRRLSMPQVTAAGQSDARLGMMLAELQRIFGGVLSESDVVIFVTLYAADKIPADLLLTAATHCVADGKINARYIEKVVLSWQRQGITDAEAADRFLQQEALRAQREELVVGMMGLSGNPFTLAEKRRIAEWFEGYGYGREMIEAARLAAGDKQNEVRYLGAILKKWNSKGYRTPRDVQDAGENRNLRVQSSRTGKAEDMLRDIAEYVPMKPRRKAP